MMIRVVNPSDGSGAVTFPAPDAYGTPTTLMAGTVLDVIPGGSWEAAIGTGNLTPLAGVALADDQQGDAQTTTAKAPGVALNRYVLTATVTVGAGTAATVTASEPGMGGAAGFGNQAISAGAEDWPTTFMEGTAIVLDSASALFSALLVVVGVHGGVRFALRGCGRVWWPGCVSRCPSNHSRSSVAKPQLHR